METCKVSGCGKKHHSKGLCSKHYMRMYRNGTTERIVPSPVRCEGSVCIIDLLDKNKNKTGEAIIDNDDLDKVIGYRWRLASKGKHYSMPMNNERVPLDYLIMDSPKGTTIDHIDGNPFNNCKYNLRLATQSQQLMNRRKWYRKCTSIYKGVWMPRDRKRWVAEIQKGEDRRRLGSFHDEWQAAQAYNKAALEMFGEFARLNVKDVGCL